jgi:5-formaminoimidazole-4-carboxamide-1-beta-D-ribofuranosyl 5'-monophosphate synthetase
MDENTKLKIGLFTILVIGIIAIGFISMNHSKVNIAKAEESYLQSLEKRDSLNKVIDSLRTEIIFLEDGFDLKERRYEDVINEYELGISYLKDYHPTAYKDFHRIIGMKERYSAELNRENSKRLNQYKTK